jgi:delta 1-pyrroline-5-carboxylate dehydrogenase
MKHEFRMASLVLVPYAVATLTAVGAATYADAPSSHSAVPAPSALYDRCRELSQPDPSETAREGRAQQLRQDPQARSQRPAWQAQAQADIEHCLRGPAGNWAQRRPSTGPAAL